MKNLISKKVKIFSSAYEKFKIITTSKELSKHRLTLADHEMLYDVLKELSDIKKDKKVYCLSKNVAEWLKRAGMHVEAPHDGNAQTLVNYTISII